MKKTSRRTFSKQLTGAVAALPVAAMISETATGQDNNKAMPKVTSNQSITTSHNTPPSLVIAEGSLNIESAELFTESGSGAGPFMYKSTTSPTLGHIRVFQDNGDKLYEDLESDSSKIKIVWEDDDPSPGSGSLTIETAGAEFVLTSDKRLQPPPASPAAAHRKFKYNHPGSGPAKRMRIKSVEVTNYLGMTTAFAAPPRPRTPAGGLGDFVPHEFRVLVWRH